MRKLAFAFTQLHLLNLINLRTSLYRNDEMDLIAFSPKGTGAMEVVKRAEEKGVFNRVLIVDNYYPQAKGINKIYYRLLEMFVAVKNKRKIKNFLGENNYDEFLTYGSNMEAYMAYTIASKKNNVKMVFYEEGIGTYTERITYALKPWHTLLLKSQRIKIPALPDELYVYVPEMIVTPIPRCITVRKIPTLSNVETINELWNYTGGTIELQYKSILLEEPVDNNEWQIKAFHAFNKNSSAIKMHPRSLNKQLYSDMHFFDNTGLMWEIYCMNCCDLSHHVFVSEYSTACFTPKCLLGEEPIVIFTAGIYEAKEVSYTTLQTIISKFRESYNDKSRVLLPRSYEELKEMIKELKC